VRVGASARGPKYLFTNGLTSQQGVSSVFPHINNTNVQSVVKAIKR